MTARPRPRTGERPRIRELPDGAVRVDFAGTSRVLRASDTRTCQVTEDTPDGDRKSTRLNSSH